MPQLTMPNVGEGVAEGTVTRWLRHEGDDVALDEPIVEVETDKAVVEIPSPFAGKLAKILVEEGATVPIGAPLAEFVSAGEAMPGEPARTEAGVGTAAGAGSANGHAGGTAGAEHGRAAAPTKAAAGNGASPARERAADGDFRRTRQYSPVVLRLASEHDIDLALVQGTGIDGRVTRKDVLAYIENPVMHTVPPGAGEGVVGARPASGGEQRRAPAAAPSTPAPPVSAAEPAASAAPSPAMPGERDERIPLSATRRTIATRMLESQQTIPPAWMMAEADVTGLVALRGAAKAEFERREGVPLTYMPFFVQSITAALKEHPELNSTFGDGEIVVHHRYDIGIAVAVESGLVVPVLRDADRLSVTGLAHALHDLGEKARTRKLTVEDMRAPTFTIDNTGAFGSIASQPIVPPGQAAIITTEAVRRELRPSDDGSFAVRSLMNLCISFDHRALDGAQAGAFMRDVKQRLEAYRPDDSVY